MILCKDNAIVWVGLADSPVEDVDFDSVYLSFSDHAVAQTYTRAKAKSVNSR
jgi:hypothetical protein